MLSHGFKRSFVSILSMLNLPRQPLQCQITPMPITIQRSIQPITGRHTSPHAYVIDQVASMDALQSKVAIATVDNGVHVVRESFTTVSKRLLHLSSAIPDTPKNKRSIST
jgi:hypothetical protein